MLNLAHRMKLSFCRTLGASSINTRIKIASKTGEDVRVTSRKNPNDHGELICVILCDVSSVWLPVSPNLVFYFLRDDKRRHEGCNGFRRTSLIDCDSPKGRITAMQ